MIFCRFIIILKAKFVIAKVCWLSSYSACLDRIVLEKLLYEVNVVLYKMMRRFLSNEKNSKGLSAKGFHNSIKAHFRKVFLFDKLINSRYDGISGLGNHVKILFDMAYELKALGLDVSNEFMANCLMSSMPENHTKHAQNDKFSMVCKFCKLPLMISIRMASKDK